MNLYFYNNCKKIILICVILLLTGSILAFLKLEIEPQETIAGVFCGLGVSMILFPLSQKKD